MHWKQYVVENYLKQEGENYDQFKPELRQKLFEELISEEESKILNASKILIHVDDLHFTPEQLNIIYKKCSHLPISERKMYRDYRQDVAAAIMVLKNFADGETCKCKIYLKWIQFLPQREIEMDFLKLTGGPRINKEKLQKEYDLECKVCQTKWQANEMEVVPAPYVKWIKKSAGTNKLSTGMKIRMITDTFSLQNGDVDPCQKDEEIVKKLLFNCESLEKIKSDQKTPKLLEISFTKYQLIGKVIFKGQYLLIIDSHIRIGLVLNNEFRQGNHIYMGNNEIDHTYIAIGDTVKVTGRFIFSPLHFCVFTFKRSEFELPIVDYKWKASKFYINTQASKENAAVFDVDAKSSFEEIKELNSGDDTAPDYIVLEYELADTSPVWIDQGLVALAGDIESINFVLPNNWIRNCGGKIMKGVKFGKWYYYDKKGKEKIELDYGNE